MTNKIFICHRHDESDIADVINKHLQLWGIPSKDIFQSSKARSGPRTGAKLDDELKKALNEANLLIFVYTHEIYDWSYCTWECGLAQDPATLNTNIIVFECAGETPAIFRPNVRIRITPEDIKKFTKEFNQDENFFPNQPAFNPTFSDDIIDEMSERLYQDLVKVIPLGKYTIRPLLHLLSLALAAKHVEMVRKQRRPEDANSYIEEHLVIADASPFCPEHFGFATFDKNMKWLEVIKRWKNKAAENKSFDYPELWINDLYNEMWRAINNVQAQPAGGILRSVSNENPDRQYIPLICEMREYPGIETLFNVFLYRKN